MQKRCRNCSYNNRGHCHRHPPQVERYDENSQFGAGRNTKTHWVFPCVDPDDWCGEHDMAEGFIKVGGTD